MDNLYLEKLHREILCVMDEVDRICTIHKLKYYLIGGTLLGAIRHGGFIPWDDDLDIVMPRADFDKFIDIAQMELNKPFALAWTTTQKDYRRLYAKVENTDTVFFEGVRYRFGYPGIFVDIFPLDITQGYSASLERRKRIVKKLATIKGMKASGENYGYIKNTILRLLPYTVLNCAISCFMKLSNHKDGKWYTNFGSQYSVKKQTILIEAYGEGKKIAFEDRAYCAPSQPEVILKSIFGDSYLQLPPEEKRRTHLPQCVKFSNGEEIKFEIKGENYRGDFE